MVGTKVFFPYQFDSDTFLQQLKNNRVTVILMKQFGELSGRVTSAWVLSTDARSKDGIVGWMNESVFSECPHVCLWPVSDGDWQWTNNNQWMRQAADRSAWRRVGGHWPVIGNGAGCLVPQVASAWHATQSVANRPTYRIVRIIISLCVSLPTLQRWVDWPAQLCAPVQSLMMMLLLLPHRTRTEPSGWLIENPAWPGKLLFVCSIALNKLNQAKLSWVIS